MGPRLRRLVATIAVLGSTACGGHALQRGAKTPAAVPASDASKATNRAFSALSARLAALKDAGDPLDSLTPGMLQAGHGLIGKLSASERKSLLGVGSRHPVFHLLAGGRDPAALTRVRHEGSNDLLTLWQASGNAELEGLLPILREITLRAAKRWLALTSAKLRSPKDVDVGLCDQIERVAASVGMLELARDAVEMAVSIEPSAERWLKVANAAAMTLRVERAREAIARAKKSPWKKDFPLPVADSEQRLANAELAAVELDANASNDQLLQRARALQALDLSGEVVAFLKPRTDRVKKHAGLAAALATATLGHAVEVECPVDSSSPLSQVCFAGVIGAEPMKRTVALSREAWDSKQGRDPAAAEAYVGMAYVLPIAEGFFALTKQDSEKALVKTAEGLKALDGALGEAELVAPKLEGLHLWAGALRRVFSKREVVGLWATPAERADFEARALEVAKRHGQEPWGQTGVTFAAALLAFDGNSSSLFDVLPADLEPSLRLARAWIRLWGAVVEQDLAAVKRATAELVQVMPSEAQDPIARGETILTLQEVSAATGGDPSAYKSLGEAAEQLRGPAWPVAVRVRATIDLAGVQSRSGEQARALELLRGISEEDAKAAGDLGEIAKIYALVLEAGAARGEARKPFIAQLGKIAADDPVRALSVWRDMWVRELSFASAMDGCGKNEACVRRAAKKRRLPEGEQRTRLGRWLSKLAEHGTLSHGRFRSGIGFTTRSGLFANVEFSFELPAVEYPVN